MLRLKDILLLLVIYLSIVSGVTVPRFGLVFLPYTVHLMIIVLFLSFLPIEISSIWQTIRKRYINIVLLSLLKTVAMPIGVFFLFKMVWPSYAVAAMLLSGVSTGIVAPFISNLVKANSALVLVMVVITSILVPFTLPAIVKLLLAQTIGISVYGMMRMLGLVIFVPIAAVEVLKRLSQKLAGEITKRQYPILLVILSLINQGVFSQYAAFFHQNPFTIAVCILVAIALLGIYLLIGILFFSVGNLENQLSAAITLGNINNVLIIVFASEFFGPLEPTVAAMYMFPFFGSIIPLKLYRRWRTQRAN